MVARLALNLIRQVKSKSIVCKNSVVSNKGCAPRHAQHSGMFSSIAIDTADDKCRVCRFCKKIPNGDDLKKLVRPININPDKLVPMPLQQPNRQSAGAITPSHLQHQQ